MSTTNPVIDIYTDGSGDPLSRIGAWASILFINGDRIILEGSETETTHQRMELIAIIKSIKYVEANRLSNSVNIYTDSQYALGLIERKQDLVASGFRTINNKTFRNEDLMREFLQTIEKSGLNFFKIKAHQKIKEGNYNREVDLLVRKNLRKAIAESSGT